jgi:hypothetical protein
MIAPSLDALPDRKILLVNEPLAPLLVGSTGSQGQALHEPVTDEATPDHPLELSADVWHWSENWVADVMRWGWHDGWFDIRAEDAEQDRTFIGVKVTLATADIPAPDSARWI